MTKNFATQCFRFLFFVLLQVLVVDHIHLADHICPYIYIFFLLLMPTKVSRWGLLLAAFLIGLTIDAFSGTMGLHVIPCVLIGYIRPFLLSLMGGHDINDAPSIRTMGFDWFISYAAIMIVMHHTVFFFLEIFRFDEVFSTMKEILFSSVVSLVILILAEFLFVPRKK